MANPWLKKNPFMSMWLSAANSVAGKARGQATAQAKRAGTLDRINEQVINDFAVVFSLSPKHLMRLKDILLQPEED